MDNDTEGVCIDFQDKAGLIDLKRNIKWDLVDKIVEGYMRGIFPNGDIRKDVSNNLKRIEKLIKQLRKEKKRKRKDRWYTWVLPREIGEIHNFLLIIRHQQVEMKRIFEILERLQDKQCQTSTSESKN